MRAVIAKAPGGPEVLEVVETEAPTAGEGEVEVKVLAFGLNKAESYYRSGNYGTFVPGQALGIEAVGQVLSDPSGKFAAGQRVATAMGGMMFSRHGGYAERIAVTVSHTFTVDQIQEAHRLLDSGQANGKIVVTF